MNSFVNAVETETSLTTTENGAVTYSTSTLTKALDLFSKIGSSRDTILVSEFDAALKENEDLALRILMYARDVREGLGERKQFRSLVKHLDIVNPDLARLLIPMIPELGRWDDLLHSFSTSKSISIAQDYFVTALKQKNGLAAKWAPRETGKDKNIAVALAKKLNVSRKEYRKLISSLSNTVEQKMCANKWADIEFSHVPSCAFNMYKKAFIRHEEQRFTDFISKVATGESKINASVLYPYDVLKPVFDYQLIDSLVQETMQQQWNALPNLVGDKRILPVIDVSGSMGTCVNPTLSCMNIAISLGMYVAMKNTGAYNNMYLTFSEQPQLNKITATTLQEAYKQVRGSKWGYSTNLMASFNLILDLAVKHNVPQEEMPEMVLVFSD